MPKTPETLGLIGEEALRKVKPTVRIVNVARGGLVDETALAAAIKEGRVAGAGIDVFAKEPLPEDSPFWDMENVILTQHQGGFFDGYPRFAIPVVEHNLLKWLAGDIKGMINVVKR